MGARLTLLLAAVPAIAGSVLLMREAGVSTSSRVLQLAVFAAGGILLALWPPAQRRSRSGGLHCWRSALLVALLFLPLALDAGAAPHRWINLGGVRLYLAPVMLPVLLLSWNRSASESRSRAACLAIAAIGACVGLLLQPDAAQLDGFALAMLPLLIPSRLSGLARGTMLAFMAACALAVWQRPDPLAPVAHVEGVFVLAARLSPIALVAAACAAALPAATLLWYSRRERSTGLLAVALYYLAILAHAPLQITPVPLLGFGAGPILGYCVVALVAVRAMEAAPTYQAR